MIKLTRKQRVIKKLNMTLEKLKELDDSKFNYKYYISEYNKKRGCGTVCCVAGWYPEWFPKAGLIWGVVRGWFTIQTKNFLGAIPTQLSKYHEVNDDVIQTLFYGSSISIKNNPGYIEAQNGINSTKEEVVKLFEQVIEAIENETIDWKKNSVSSYLKDCILVNEKWKK